MPKKNDYVVTRIPSNDWDNLMETVTLDGSYSEEIKAEIESALEKMQDFSEPWIMIKIKDGVASAAIFPNEELARIQVEREKAKTDLQVFLAKGKYHN